MHVVVLMSTYNGERFIEEQVASILKQLPPGGQLIVRDDGSTDSTVRKIGAFRDPRIHLERGENIGFAKSFLTLLSKAPVSAGVAMFSDQDDVWLDGKIERAVHCLAKHEGIPALYCSNQIVVNEKLGVLEVIEKEFRKTSFSHAIAENIVTGCTAAINNAALKLMQRAGVAQNIKFHDWWLYLVISAHGVVIADEKALILYRQHENNYIGRGAGWAGRSLKKIRYLRKNNWTDVLFLQISDLRSYYWPSLSEDDRVIISKYVDFGHHTPCAKWEMIFRSQLWTEFVFRDIALRVLLFMHRIRIKRSR